MSLCSCFLFFFLFSLFYFLSLLSFSPGFYSVPNVVRFVPRLCVFFVLLAQCCCKSPLGDSFYFTFVFPLNSHAQSCSVRLVFMSYLSCIFVIVLNCKLFSSYVNVCCLRNVIMLVLTLMLMSPSGHQRNCPEIIWKMQSLRLAGRLPWAKCMNIYCMQS